MENTKENKGLRLDQILFMHPKVGKGRMTLAMIVTPTPDDELVANVGLSFCSPKDQFCRKTGRTIAEGRLSKGKHTITVLLPKDATQNEFLRRVKLGIRGLDILPQWLR